MRILFCGETFASARALLQERLPSEAGDEVYVWPDCGTATDLSHVDVLIPMMFRIDGEIMDAARFRLTQQWGIGGLKASIWKPRRRTHIRQPCGIRS
jgi:hypothetical protein